MRILGGGSRTPERYVPTTPSTLRASRPHFVATTNVEVPMIKFSEGEAFMPRCGAVRYGIYYEASNQHHATIALNCALPPTVWSQLILYPGCGRPNGHHQGY